MNILTQEQIRAPICGIFGHVDSGKTSFLSKLKSCETIEAGGITQGIPSVFISIDKIKSMCEKVEDLKQIYAKEKGKSTDFEIKIPGVLFIDTPGHEAFHHFRNKASDICDLAIVIIDIEKGVEKQTLTSLQMLKTKKIPFIIVLTKLDKIYNWNTTETSNLKKSLKHQSAETINMLNSHIADVKYELSKCEINSEFYFSNKSPAKTYSIIPVSNTTMEGYNDMVNFVIYIIQNFMGKKLILEPKPKIFIMEKSFDKKLGWVLNVILSNGSIKVGDNLLVQTPNGPIKSVIRSIIGSNFNEGSKKYIKTYVSNISASNSVTIFAPGLEDAITGEFTFTYTSNEECNKYLEQLENKEIKESFIDKIKTDKLGFYLFTSTEDEFEAGYQVFTTSDVTISNGSFGVLNERAIDMFSIFASNLETDLDEYKILIYYTDKKSPKFNELEKYAEKYNIKIIHNEVIYKLVERFKELRLDVINKRKEHLKKTGQVFLPLEMKLLKEHVYMKGGNKNILCGFKICEGKVNIGTEIIGVNPKKPTEFRVLGKVLNMQKNSVDTVEASKGDEICIRLENPNHLTFSRDFSDTYSYFSNIDRPKLELLKRDFKSDLTKDNWLLVAKIAKLLNF